MSRFRDTFDATRGDDEAARKHFDEVVKRANAEADRGRKLFRDMPVEKRSDKRPNRGIGRTFRRLDPVVNDPSQTFAT
jgi:hypothetical protein